MAKFPYLYHLLMMVMANQNPWLHPCLMVKSTILGHFLIVVDSPILRLIPIFEALFGWFHICLMVIPQILRSSPHPSVTACEGLAAAPGHASAEIFGARGSGDMAMKLMEKSGMIFLLVFFFRHFQGTYQHIPNFFGRNISLLSRSKSRLVYGIGIWNSSVQCG